MSKKPTFIATLVAATLTVLSSSAATWNDSVHLYNSENFDEAIEGFKKLADKGDSEAQNFLGKSYLLGIGVNQNTEEAVKYFEMAADQGHENASFRLANMYRYGMGVPYDYGRAAVYYILPVEHGNVFAQMRLGNMYCLGQGVSQDLNEAERLFNLAANPNNPGFQGVEVKIEKGCELTLAE